jgi:hypothetical protein
VDLYSGAFGVWQNNPAYIAEVDKGPIPPGNWIAVRLIEDDPQTGEYTIVLEPADKETLDSVVALGRGPYSFRMHGDDIANPGHGSDGCIVAPRPVREEFWESPDHSLRVID